MPDRAAAPTEPSRHALVSLGAVLRAARKQQRVSTTAAAEAAGISRVTWHRIEKGEPSVASGAWAAAAEVLGLHLALVTSAGADAAAAAVPPRIRVDEYPQLKQLAWHLHPGGELTPEAAFELYERNWRHVDRLKLSLAEIEFIRRLSAALGKGELLV